MFPQIQALGAEKLRLELLPYHYSQYLSKATAFL